MLEQRSPDLIKRKTEGDLQNREAEDLQKRAERKNRRLALIFWIPALLLAAAAILTTLAFSCDNAPSAPAGNGEQAVLRLGKAILSGEEAEIPVEEAAVLLYPFLKEQMPESMELTGLSLKAPGKNRLETRAAVTAGGKKLLLTCGWTLSPSEEGGNASLYLDSVSIGRLPLPVAWVGGQVLEMLPETWRGEEGSIQLPESVSLPLWEGTAPVEVKWSGLRTEEDCFYGFVSADVNLLDFLL